MSHGTKTGSRAPSSKFGRNKRKCEKYALTHGGGQHTHSGKTRYVPTRKRDKPDMTTQRVLTTPYVQLSKSQRAKRLKTQDARGWPTLNPGRTVTVSVTYSRKGDAIGYNIHCLNCTFKKTFLSEFFGGDENAYNLAKVNAFDHQCNASAWKSK